MHEKCESLAHSVRAVNQKECGQLTFNEKLTSSLPPLSAAAPPASQPAVAAQTLA